MLDPIVIPPNPSGLIPKGLIPTGANPTGRNPTGANPTGPNRADPAKPRRPRAPRRRHARALLPRLAGDDTAHHLRLLASFLGGMIESQELRRLPGATLVRIRYVQMQLAFTAQQLPPACAGARGWLRRLLRAARGPALR